MHIPPQFDWTLEQSIRLLKVVGWSDSSEKVDAYFTTRQGGHSQYPYTSLNLGLHVGDQAQHVLENRQLLSTITQIPLSAWIAAEQVHGDRVAVVDSSDKGKGSFDYTKAISQTDALVTNQKGIVLTTYAADCVPILFYSAQGVIAVAHAGWRGTVARIAEKTIQTMCNHFGCEPTGIQAAIGPAIGACCYEVDRRVYDAMDAIGLADVCIEVDAAFGKATLEKRWMCDLSAANKRILVRAGVDESNIFMSQQCTSCHNDLYFSHRKENGKTGRHAGMIFLK